MLSKRRPCDGDTTRVARGTLRIRIWWTNATSLPERNRNRSDQNVERGHLTCLSLFEPVSQCGVSTMIEPLTKLAGGQAVDITR